MSLENRNSCIDTGKGNKKKLTGVECSSDIKQAIGTWMNFGNWELWKFSNVLKRSKVMLPVVLSNLEMCEDSFETTISFDCVSNDRSSYRISLIYQRQFDNPSLYIRFVNDGNTKNYRVSKKWDKKGLRVLLEYEEREFKKEDKLVKSVCSGTSSIYTVIFRNSQILKIDLEKIRMGEVTSWGFTNRDKIEKALLMLRPALDIARVYNILKTNMKFTDEEFEEFFRNEISYTRLSKKIEW